MNRISSVGGCKALPHHVPTNSVDYSASYPSGARDKAAGASGSPFISV